MLNQFTYFFRVVEALANLIWWKYIIDNAISKTSPYHCKDPEKHRILGLGPTRISAVNIGGTSIHSGLGDIKPWIKLLGLSDKSKATVRNTLSEVKFQLLMNCQWYQMIYGSVLIQGCRKFFLMIIEKLFAGLLVMTVGNFPQLPPVLGKFIFSPFSDKDSMKHL